MIYFMQLMNEHKPTNTNNLNSKTKLDRQKNVPH